MRHPVPGGTKVEHRLGQLADARLQLHIHHGRIRTIEVAAMCESCEATPTLIPVLAPAGAAAQPSVREPRGIDAYQRNGDAREIAFANGYVPRLVA